MIQYQVMSVDRFRPRSLGEVRQMSQIRRQDPDIDDATIEVRLEDRRTQILRDAYAANSDAVKNQQQYVSPKTFYLRHMMHIVGDTYKPVTDAEKIAVLQRLRSTLLSAHNNSGKGGKYVERFNIHSSANGSKKRG